MIQTTRSRPTSGVRPRLVGRALLLWGCLLGPLGCHAVARRAGETGPAEAASELKRPGTDAEVLQTEAPAERPQELPAPVAALPDSQPPPDPAPVTPVVPPAVAEYMLDLATALGLAEGENPTIALAREAVRAGLAEQLRARALLLPSLEAGASFDLHRGNLISAQGIIQDVDRQSLYAGAGASAVGAGTVGFPGVRLYGHLADVLFDPAAARRRVTELEFGADATRNDILLAVATRYFALAGAEARLEAVRQSEREFGEVATLTANFAGTGQGREGDAERARSAALLLHTESQRAEEEVAVASAELARLLSTDPSVRLRTPAGSLAPLEIVDLSANLETLVQTALQNRPEVGASAAALAVRETQLRKERARPLLPFLSVGYSAGDFGGGSDQADTRFGHFRGRTDFDVSAVWSLQNFGLGNLAVQRRRRAEVNEALAERTAVLDRIRREVAEAYALVAASRREVEVARRRVETAARAYRSDLTRSKNLQGRAIEILNSLNLLNAARQDLVRAVTAYDDAQLRLLVAVGEPPDQALARGRCPTP